MADFPMPDLSNLTEEERRQIEDVINRQKHEEAKDKEVVQSVAPFLIYKKNTSTLLVNRHLFLQTQSQQPYFLQQNTTTLSFSILESSAYRFCCVDLNLTIKIMNKFVN